MGMTLLLLLSIASPLAPSPIEMLDQSIVDERHSVSDSMVSYDLFVAEQNSSAGGMGFITTHVPDSGGQSDESAIGGVEFKSSDG